jgi:serine/threonine protein kinase, bacterial
VEASQQSDTLVGVVLDGRYRVDGMIATGGMSTVYRGLDVRLDRPVALKVMDSRYSGDQQFLTRFQREARAVARLKDPGLVAVYDQGFDGRHPFLVMELVEGGTLRELLHERGPMPPHAVAAVLAPVLSGLAVAHRAGLVHRDVKPENVLISDDGDVKIADFGLVRAVADAKITSASVILGTAAYLSPEQVATGTASPRSDVYAVGILAYELLTGTTPFTGDSALSIAYQRMDNEVPAPGTAITGVPAQFDEFVLCATARHAADRYADAQEMGAELEAISEELRLPPFRVPAPRNSAQHQAAAAYHFTAEQRAATGGSDAMLEERTTAVTAGSPPPQPILPVRTPGKPPIQHTREFDRDEAPKPLERRSGARQSGQFAGIEFSEFEWARQRGRRTLLLWVLVILMLTGLVAAGAWTLGSNLSGLL